MRIKEFKELAKDCLCMMAVIPAGVTSALVQLIGRCRVVSDISCAGGQIYHI